MGKNGSGCVPPSVITRIFRMHAPLDNGAEVNFGRYQRKTVTMGAAKKGK